LAIPLRGWVISWLQRHKIYFFNVWVFAEGRAQMMAVAHIDYHQNAPAGIAPGQAGYLLDHVLLVCAPLLLHVAPSQPGDGAVEKVGAIVPTALVDRGRIRRPPLNGGQASPKPADQTSTTAGRRNRRRPAGFGDGHDH